MTAPAGHQLAAQHARTGSSIGLDVLSTCSVTSSMDHGSRELLQQSLGIHGSPARARVTMVVAVRTRTRSRWRRCTGLCYLHHDCTPATTQQPARRSRAPRRSCAPSLSRSVILACKPLWASAAAPPSCASYAAPPLTHKSLSACAHPSRARWFDGNFTSVCHTDSGSLYVSDMTKIKL